MPGAPPRPRIPMATATNPARKLFSSFKTLGLSAPQVRALMPDWWDDEAATDEGGLLELQILLARRLNVSLVSLQSQKPQPAFRSTTQRFKTVHPEGSSQLAVAASIGHGLAQLLASSCASTPLQPPVDADTLRKDLLKNNEAVTLDALCEWLWTAGIPVVHVTGWPDGLRRPDAMCVRASGRPVVIVVRKETALAKLAYLIAHEAGHIMNGHLSCDENAVLVDDTLSVDSQQSFFDQDEKQADAYAMTLLGGSALFASSKKLVGPDYSEMSLAAAALGEAQKVKLDAGQVILSWARLTEDWKLANLALRFLKTTEIAPVVINDVAKRHMNFEMLPNDGLDHIFKLTGMDLRSI